MRKNKYALELEAAHCQGEIMAYGQCLIYIDDLIDRYLGNSTTGDTVLLLLKDKVRHDQYSALKQYNKITLKHYNEIKAKWDK